MVADDFEGDLFTGICESHPLVWDVLEEPHLRQSLDHIRRGRGGDLHAFGDERGGDLGASGRLIFQLVDDLEVVLHCFTEH